jgi:hypothetical protein
VGSRLQRTELHDALQVPLQRSVVWTGRGEVGAKARSSRIGRKLAAAARHSPGTGLNTNSLHPATAESLSGWVPLARLRTPPPESARTRRARQRGRTPLSVSHPPLSAKPRTHIPRGKAAPPVARAAAPAPKSRGSAAPDEMKILIGGVVIDCGVPDQTRAVDDVATNHEFGRRGFLRVSSEQRTRRIVSPGAGTRWMATSNPSRFSRRAAQLPLAGPLQHCPSWRAEPGNHHTRIVYRQGSAPPHLPLSPRRS